MDIVLIAQFALATLMPVAACILLMLLRSRVASRLPNAQWQVLVGLVFVGHVFTGLWYFVRLLTGHGF